jgi:hypothetical protein
LAPLPTATPDPDADAPLAFPERKFVPRNCASVCPQRQIKQIVPRPKLQTS